LLKVTINTNNPNPNIHKCFVEVEDLIKMLFSMFLIILTVKLVEDYDTAFINIK